MQGSNWQKAYTVAVEATTALFLISVILSLNPRARVTAKYYAQWARWWLWYVQLPTWKQEALRVRGWIR